MTVIFLQIQLGALDLKETDNCTTHFMWQPCTSPARQRANIITVTLSMVSLSAVGTHPEINDVHSMNLMDQMSPRLWMWVQRGSVFFFFFFPFLEVNMFMSPVRQGPGERRQWVRPVPSKAPCVQSRTRSTETAGWWVGTMLLSHTHRKEKEVFLKKKKKKKAREENLAFDWGIIRDCLTYLSP